MYKPINNKMTFTNDLVQKIVEGAQEKKGRDIVFIDLADKEMASVSGHLLCTGNTGIQVEAIADSIREYVQKNAGQKPFNYDGYQNAQWIVIDYGTIYAHIFTPEQRERYKLEELWSDADITKVPDID